MIDTSGQKKYYENIIYECDNNVGCLHKIIAISFRNKIEYVLSFPNRNCKSSNLQFGLKNTFYTQIIKNIKF